MKSYLPVFGILVLAALLAACSSGGGGGGGARALLFPSAHELLVVAHRGASGYAPENTMPAFQKALDLGADMIETDVQRTEDNQLVLMHDDTLSRTSNGSGRVDAHSWEEISALDAGAWFASANYSGVRVPKLEELFALVQDRPGCSLLLDIKANYLGVDLVQLVKNYNLSSRVLYSASDQDILKEIKGLDPQARLAPEVVQTFTSLTQSSITDYGIVNLEWNFLTRGEVPVLMGKNIKVFVYTLDDKDEIRAAAKYHVEGIISDYPDRVIDVLNE